MVDHRSHRGVPANTELPAIAATESSSWPTRRQISARAPSLSDARAATAKRNYAEVEPWPLKPLVPDR